MAPVPTVESLTTEGIVVGRHSTFLAAGSAIGFVVYTETKTRAVMNASHSQTNI